MIAFRSFLFSVFLLFALSACGGGGGGSKTPTGTKDTTPDAFAFKVVSNAAPELTYSSDSITVSGINAAAAISIKNGEYSVDGGTFRSDAGTVSNGQKVVVRGAAPDALGASRSITLSVGGVNSDFVITTGESALALEVQSFGRLAFSWNEFAGVTHYNLLENADGASGFSPVVEGIDGSLAAYTHETGPVQMVDWLNGEYALEACNDNFCMMLPGHTVNLTQAMSAKAIGYIKASNTDEQDWFGYNIAVSADGNTLAVSATFEDSDTDGIDGNQQDNSANGAGAVYVFQRNEGVWQQQAYLKPSASDANDGFGVSLALSADGNTLVVGAWGESSDVGGPFAGDAGIFDEDNSLNASGAAYVFSRTGSEWSQQAYLKASNTDALDFFGSSVAISGDGDRVAIAALGEASIGTGIGGNQLDDSAAVAGAVYVYERSGTTWSMPTYIKASNTEAGDGFGFSLALSDDGQTLAVGAAWEDSPASIINGDQGNDPDLGTDYFAGAVYVFFLDPDLGWQQQAYLKASNTDASDNFGRSVSLSADGNRLAVGAYHEDSNGDPADNSMANSGAVYVFSRSEATLAADWEQQAYIKAPNSDENDAFGTNVALSRDGTHLAIGAPFEDGAGTGIGSDMSDDSSSNSGAAYLFEFVDGGWTHRTYLKASNTDSGDSFSESGDGGGTGGTGLAFSDDGRLFVSARTEDSNATGIDGDQENNDASNAGAVYVY